MSINESYEDDFDEFNDDALSDAYKDKFGDLSFTMYEDGSGHIDDVNGLKVASFDLVTQEAWVRRVGASGDLMQRGNHTYIYGHDEVDSLLDVVGRYLKPYMSNVRDLSPVGDAGVDAVLESQSEVGVSL